MASPTPPRRRHPPAVYRRRRIVVLLVLLALVAGVWLLIAQPWSSAAGAEQNAAPAASTPSAKKQTATALPSDADETSAPAPEESEGEPTPDPSSTEPASVACLPDDLLVEPVVDKDTYRSSENPKLWIALTNTSREDCTLNVGTSTQKFTITSGSDVWWRSTDCQAKPSDQIVLLGAGQKVLSATPLEWDRTRSSVSTCEGKRPVAPGGGASYHLTVEIAGVESNGSAQFLLY